MQISTNYHTTRIRLPSVTALEADPPAIFASRLALREGNNKKPVYQIHKWWARRLGSVFRAVLLSAVTPASKSGQVRNGAFYQKHDFSGLIVLDPFVGGGTSVVEAAKLGANVIGVDIDPVACFVTRKELEHADEVALLNAFQAVEAKVKQQILRFYRTRLPDGRTGTAIYVFWVDLIRCPHCRQESFGHPHYQLNRDPKTRKQTVFCSHCGEITSLPLRRKRFECTRCGRTTEILVGPVRNGQEFACPNCDVVTPISNITGPNRRLRQRIFALQVLIDGTEERVFKKAEREDARLYSHAERIWGKCRENDKFVPRAQIPTKDRDDARPIAYGYKLYSDLFNSRQLLCLSILAKAISETRDTRAKEFLATAFSDSLAANNMFCLYAFDYDKLTPLFGLHAYRRVSRPVENNVWGLEYGRGSFLKCFRKLLRGKKYSARPYENRYQHSSSDPEHVFTGETGNRFVHSTFSPQTTKLPYASILHRSAENLSPIMSKTVDIILTDPPYYDNLPYSELSDFFHVWLRRLHLRSYAASSRHSPISESMYVRRDRPKRRVQDHEAFVGKLRRVLKECYRVLKPGGLMIFTFHHKEEKAWSAMADALIRSGFVVTKAFPVRSEGQSKFHSAEGNLKWDMVFVCRKRAMRAKRRWRKSYLRLLALHDALDWRRILLRNGFGLNDADLQSLWRGFIVARLTRKARTNSLKDLLTLPQVDVGHRSPWWKHSSFRK